MRLNFITKNYSFAFETTRTYYFKCEPYVYDIVMGIDIDLYTYF